MQTLNLHIEHGVRVDLHTKRVLNILRKALLVALLDRSPLLPEGRVFGVLEQALNFRELLEPGRLRHADRVRDELGQARVALVEPAARGNA